MARELRTTGQMRDRSRIIFLLITLLWLAAGTAHAQGWSWSSEAVDKSGRFTGVAVDTGGNVHLSYSTVYGEIKYAFRPAHASQWFTMVIDRTLPDTVTGITLDAEGNPHICYTPDVMKYSYWDGKKWQIEQIAPGSGLIGYTCSIVVAPDGTPHVTWYQVNYGQHTNYLHMRYAVRRDGVWMVQTVDMDPETGKWNSLVADPQGNLHLSYSAYHIGLKYARRAGKSWVTRMVDGRGEGSFNYRGMGNSLALDRNGNPVISYFDTSDRILKLAQLRGDRWSIEKVDTLSPSVGTIDAAWWVWRSSIVLDPKGHPHIVYSDYGALKHAYGDGQRWQVESVASGGADLYRNSALAMDGQGILYVSYQDAVDGSLKVAVGRPGPPAKQSLAASEQKEPPPKN